MRPWGFPNAVYEMTAKSALCDNRWDGLDAGWVAWGFGLCGGGDCGFLGGLPDLRAELGIVGGISGYRGAGFVLSFRGPCVPMVPQGLDAPRGSPDGMVSC